MRWRDSPDTQHFGGNGSSIYVTAWGPYQGLRT